MKSSLVRIPALALLLGSGVGCFGQMATGNIGGQVEDSTGVRGNTIVAFCLR